MGTTAGPAEPLSEIVVKYRALIEAQRRHQELRQEVARLFTALSEDQKTTYIETVERIDAEER